MSATLRPLFPIGLDLVGQPVLVIGGEDEARDKAARLLDAEALVTVVSPAAEPQIRSWAASGRLVWLRRTVRPADLRGRRLVVSTLTDGQSRPIRPSLPGRGGNGCCCPRMTSPTGRTWGCRR